MNRKTTHSYAFGPFRLDTGERLLFHNDEVIPLAPKAMELLLVLVGNSGHLVEKEELMQRLWPDSFVEEANLSHHIFTLRKALGDGVNRVAYIETVPKRGYRFVGTVNEWNDGGIAETARVEPRSNAVTGLDADRPPEVETALKRSVSSETVLSQQAKWVTRKKVIGAFLVVVVGLVIGVLLFTASRSGPKRIAVERVRSIAVLPFNTIDSDNNDEYLGLAMADAVITRLGSLDQLIVRPTSDVFKYEGKNPEPQAAGRQLRVEAILAGNIQRSGDRMRLTAQLISVTDGRSVWTGKFDEKATDLFALEDAVSEAVANSLLLKLGADEEKLLTRRYTDDPEAHKLYIRGRYFLDKMDEEDLKKARVYFEHAIQRDPDYALAFVGLADSYLLSDIVPPEALGRKARKLVSTALEMDETLAEAHITLAAIRIFYDWDWPGADVEIQRSMQLKPNFAWAHLVYARYWQALGRLDKALAEIEKAQELDPLSLKFMASAIQIFLSARQNDRAIEQCRMALEIDPHFGYAYLRLAQAYELEAMYEDAVPAWQKALSVLGENDLLRTFNEAHPHQGYERARRAVLIKQLQQLEEQSRREYIPAIELALICSALGHKNDALKWLERAYDSRDFDLFIISTWPEFDNLRSEPRFQAILRKMGLPTEITLPR